MYNEQNYAGMVKFVRESMSLDIKIRLGLSNIAGPNGAPAWVEMPNPMPPFGTAELSKRPPQFHMESVPRSKQVRASCLRIAHELSHIVLNGISHPLREHETAVDLTAMLLGYRDIYVLGCERREVDVLMAGIRGSKPTATINWVIWSRNEVGYAATLLGRPSEPKPKANFLLVLLDKTWCSGSGRRSNNSLSIDDIWCAAR